MDHSDQLSALFWLAISISVCLQAVQIDIGTFGYPGPGFFPFLSGVILGTLSIILVIKSTLMQKAEVRLTNSWKGMEWSKIVLLLTSLFMYAILLPILGYLITTFGLMAFMYDIKFGSGMRRIWIKLASAFITVLVTYFAFSIWLGVPLPKGIFPF